MNYKRSATAVEKLFVAGYLSQSLERNSSIE
jgi:hypothetical protein